MAYSKTFNQKHIHTIDLTLIFFIALVLRLIMLTFSVEQSGFDAFWSSTVDTVNYFSIANDFLDGTNYAERFLFIFGPGFGAYLALIMTVCGEHIFPILFINIIISASSCCLMYLLANHLFHNRLVSIIASLLMVVSYTAISLSIIVLSDTLFFFLFLLSLYTLLTGIQKNRRLYFICSGLFMGYAILVRSIGQFWFVPIAIIILLSLTYHRTMKVRDIYNYNKEIIQKGAITIAIILIVICTVSIRNYTVHNVFAITSTASGGLANVAAFTYELLDGTPRRAVRTQWYNDFMEENNRESITEKEMHIINQKKAITTFLHHPITMIQSHLLTAWTNANEINSLNRILFPKTKKFAIKIEHFIRNYKLNYSGFILTILGLILLAINRHHKTMAIIALIYAYYFVMIGSYYWQGSRLFFPAEIASSLSIAYLLVYCFQKIKRRLYNT